MDQGKIVDTQRAEIQSLRARVADLERMNDMLSKSLAEDESFIDLTSDIFYVIDLQGNLQRWNKQLEKLCGLSPEQMKGRPAALFVYEEDRAIVAADMGTVFQTGFAANVYRFFRHDGRTIPFHCTGTTIRNPQGEIIGFSGTGRDITDMKHKEDELRRAKEAAESANKLKDKFISLLSHDLRSPLSNTLVSLELLKEENGNPLLENEQKLLAKSIRSCESMLAMIDSLLDSSRFRGGGLRLRKKYNSARDLVEYVLRGSAVELDRKNIKVENELTDEQRLFVDKDLFCEVVRNIISNAVKFSSDGGVIRISRGNGAGKNYEDKTSIVIRDEGVGMTPDQIKKLLDPKVIHTTPGTNGERGSGLGFGLSRDIITAHGGAIEVASEPGKYSEFRLVLPSPRAVVLIVDDQEVARNTYKDTLRNCQLQFLEAENGLEALTIIEETMPDLVITDFFMPQMDGFELVRHLRHSPRTSHLPILMGTSSTGLEDRQKALDIGANDFFVKPVLAEELIPRVMRYIR